MIIINKFNTSISNVNSDMVSVSVDLTCSGQDYVELAKFLFKTVEAKETSGKSQ